MKKACKCKGACKHKMEKKDKKMPKGDAVKKSIMNK